AQDGISLIQTAEGALNETHSILQRVRELAVQSANDTNTNADRVELQKEVTELTAEIDRISTTTEFNTKKLLNGTGASSVVFHIGANTGQNITLNIGNMGAGSLGVAAASVNISTQTGANAAIATLDTAIASVSAERSKLGANQNRLEHTINNLGTTSENLSAAESRVRDVDMAKEMMNQTKNNILAQASQAMLAQANQQPQAVLQLLR
ncbi:flagellin, partial [Paenibacillus xylanexedens]|uniref:flagellin n=2 Tax=Paenibacillus TaxID=44249 RepID=UPI001C8DAEA6